MSDVAKTFDVFGWFAPTTIKVKILLQKLWEEGIGWDAQVPAHIKDEWLRWRSELHKLASKHISRCYFQTDLPTTSVQLHGFADASEVAYAAVVYIRYIDMSNDVRVSLVMGKTKVAPIKRLSISRLELCGHICLHNYYNTSD